MKWHDHSKTKFPDEHAFLSPSAYHWMNYSDEKLIAVFKAKLAAKLGSETHDFARLCIERKQELPDEPKTLNMYVNDAIGFRLKPEQRLVYSKYAYGKADAIGYRKERGKTVLRVHDLKTGVTKASFHQLDGYVALFCLEYGKDPLTIDLIEERIYQNNDIYINVPETNQITKLMATIRHFDELLTRYEEGEADE